MGHVSAVIASEGACSTEKTVKSRRHTFTLGFLEKEQFVWMPFGHCRRDLSVANGYVDFTSQLLSAVSGDATQICCGGSNVDYIKALDSNPCRKAGVQYRFSLTPMQFERLLHTPSFSVLGRTDLFSILRTIFPRLYGLLDESWVLSTQLFRRVSCTDTVPLFPLN